MYPNKDEVSDKTDTSLFDGKNPIDEIAKDDIINTYRTRCSTCKIGGAFKLRNFHTYKYGQKRRKNNDR